MTNKHKIQINEIEYIPIGKDGKIINFHHWVYCSLIDILIY